VHGTQRGKRNAVRREEVGRIIGLPLLMGLESVELVVLAGVIYPWLLYIKGVVWVYREIV